MASASSGARRAGLRPCALSGALLWALAGAACAQGVAATQGAPACRQGRVEMIVGGIDVPACMRGADTVPTRAGAHTARGTTTAPPGPANHRVPAPEQRHRDDERVRILQAELGDERRRGEGLRPASPEYTRHRENVAALQRELMRAGASVAH